MNELLEDMKHYVFQLFKEKLDAKFVYHSFLHTERVVASANEIIGNLELTTEENFVIITAAWFHDTGYINGMDNHEKASVAIATSFLQRKKISDTIINKVSECIRATKIDVQPKNITEEVIKDADASHFAKDYFRKVSELLRQELGLVNQANYSVTDWRKENIELLTSAHKYYTTYAVTNWLPKKNENLLKLVKKEDKRNRKLQLESFKAKEKANYKNDSPERGIQTLYRVTLRNHIKLSDIADTKANILLSVNAIIISLALANLIPKLDAPTNKHLILPSLVLILFSVASVILSILSTKPKVTSGQFTAEQIENKEVNLLFFGNFHKMKFEAYLNGLQEVLKDKNYIYEMLTKDLYFLGVVLHKKYKLLQTTYIVFTIGIVVSVITFIIAFINLK